MKKIFTLILMTLLLGGVANAKEEVAAFSPWSESVTVNGTTWSIPGGYQGAGTVIENGDKLAFDYVYIKYSGATGSPTFAIVYNEWLKKESWGDSYVTIGATLPDGSGVVGIKLDKESVMVKGSAETDGEGIGDVYAKHVKQIQIQSGSAPATVTVEGVWFGTKEEYAADGGDVPVRPAGGESLTIWSGNHVYGSNWADTDVFDAKYFDVAEVGDVIRCNITDGANANPVFKYIDWNDFTALQNNRVVKSDYFEAEIPNEEALSYLKKNGLRIQGVNFTLTSAVLIARIDYVETGKSITVSDNGFIAASEFEGLNDNAKIVFTINVKGDASGYSGWGIGRVGSHDATESAVPSVVVGEFSVKGTGEHTISVLYSDIKKALAATADGIGFDVWGFDENKCYAERVKVEVFDVATAIENVVTSAAQPAAGAVYNLAGQKVDAAYKGVVIKNGKKYVQK